MPLLQVRDFPPDLYEILKDTAKLDNRSLAQETVVLLRESLGGKETAVARRRARLSKLDTLHQKYPVDEAKTLDPVQLIREDRDR